jgi:AcrR family transcriptional regulator
MTVIIGMVTSNTDRLLDSAIEVFGERGYDRAGVAEIARRAGLTTGAIYSRYSGKADLLVEALDAPMADHLESLISTVEPDGPIDTLSMLGTDLIDARGDCDAVFLEAVVAARREPDLADMLARRLEGEHLRLAKLVEEAKADGTFDPGIDTHAALTFIQALGVGFTILRLLEVPMPGHPEWRRVIETVLDGVAPTDPAVDGEDDRAEAAPQTRQADEGGPR